MIVQILPAARADLEFAADFYESQREGLGADFLAAIVYDIDGLRMNAGVHRLEYGFHKSISKRFPFAIYYLVEMGSANVYAVVDCRQNPDSTAKRLS